MFGDEVLLYVKTLKFMVNIYVYDLRQHKIYGLMLNF